MNWVDNAVNETKYVLTRTGGPGATLANGTVTGGTATSFNLPVNSISYVDNGLVEGAPYQYDLVASNSFGNSTVLSGAFTAPVLQAPAQLTGLQASATALTNGSQTNYTTTLTWPTSNAPAVTRYTVTTYVNGVATTTNNVAPVAGATQSRAMTTLRLGNNYSFTVTATNSKGVSVDSAPVVVNMLPANNGRPIATAGATGSKLINVSWTNTSSNLLTPLSSAFTLQRRTAAANGGAVGAWTTVVTTSGTPAVQGITYNATTATYNFTDTGASAGQGYNYQVLATSAAGSTLYSTASARVVTP